MDIDNDLTANKVEELSHSNCCYAPHWPFTAACGDLLARWDQGSGVHVVAAAAALVYARVATIALVVLPTTAVIDAFFSAVWEGEIDTVGLADVLLQFRAVRWKCIGKEMQVRIWLEQKIDVLIHRYNILHHHQQQATR